MTAIWDFFGDAANRELLSWIGGCLAVVLSGL